MKKTRKPTMRGGQSSFEMGIACMIRHLLKYTVNYGGWEFSYKSLKYEDENGDEQIPTANMIVNQIIHNYEYGGERVGAFGIGLSEFGHRFEYSEIAVDFLEEILKRMKTKYFAGGNTLGIKTEKAFIAKVDEALELIKEKKDEMNKSGVHPEGGGGAAPSEIRFPPNMVTVAQRNNYASQEVNKIKKQSESEKQYLQDQFQKEKKELTKRINDLESRNARLIEDFEKFNNTRKVKQSKSMTVLPKPSNENENLFTNTLEEDKIKVNIPAGGGGGFEEPYESNKDMPTAASGEDSNQFVKMGGTEVIEENSSEEEDKTAASGQTKKKKKKKKKKAETEAIVATETQNQEMTDNLENLPKEAKEEIMNTIINGKNPFTHNLETGELNEDGIKLVELLNKQTKLDEKNVIKIINMYRLADNKQKMDDIATFLGTLNFLNSEEKTNLLMKSISILVNQNGEYAIDTAGTLINIKNTTWLYSSEYVTKTMTDEEIQNFTDKKIRYFEDGVQTFKNLFYHILYFNTVKKPELKLDTALKIIEMQKEIKNIIAEQTYHGNLYRAWYLAGIYYLLNYKTRESVAYISVGQKKPISTRDIVNNGFSENFDLFKTGFTKLYPEFEKRGIKEHTQLIKGIEFIFETQNANSVSCRELYIIAERDLQFLALMVELLGTDEPFVEKNKYDAMVDDINRLIGKLESNSQYIIKNMISHAVLRDKMRPVYKTLLPKIYQNPHIQNIIEKIKNKTATPYEIQIKKSIKKLETILERFLIYSSPYSEEELHKNSNIALEKLVDVLKTRKDEDKMTLLLSEIGRGGNKGGANTQRRKPRKQRKQRKYTRKQKQYRNKKHN